MPWFTLALILLILVAVGVALVLRQFVEKPSKRPQDPPFDEP